MTYLYAVLLAGMSYWYAVSHPLAMHHLYNRIGYDVCIALSVFLLVVAVSISVLSRRVPRLP